MRADHLINLGITNQKCHAFKNITITGRTALDYISTDDLSENALKSIGKLIMYIIDNILPTTTYPDVFSIQNEYEREYIGEFGK